MSAALLADLDVAEAALARIRAALAAAPPAAPPAPAPAAAPDIRAAAGLADPKAFFDAIRASDTVFGGRLNQAQVAGCQAILALAAGRLPLAWAAYCLATAYHETGHTMQPVRERGAGDGPDADPWDDYLEKYDTGKLAEALGNTPAADGDGILWAGRGLVQITGARNYRFADRRLHELGVLTAEESLVRTPDLALRLDVAVACLVFGALEGWFTGKTLNHYLPARASPHQFAQARRIINGVDRAELIARIAAAFQAALIAGGWT